MTETEWAAKINESRERAMRLQARLAAGEAEADAAHAEGFLTERDVNDRAARLRAALSR